MRLIRILSIVSLLLFAGAGCSAAWADDDPPVAPENDPGDPPFPVQLQALVNFYGFHEINDLCVVAYKSNPYRPIVFWPIEDTYIEAGPGSDDIMEASDYWDIKEEAYLGPHPDAPMVVGHFEIMDNIKDCWSYGKTIITRKTNGGWTPISKHPEFATIKEQLQYLVNDQGSRRINTFCAIGQQYKAYLAAIVIWQTEQELFVWLPNSFDKQYSLSVDVAPVQIDLKHDLRDQKDFEDYRDEMQRSYAGSILNACARFGERYTIIRFDKFAQ